MVKAVFDNMAAASPKNHFTVGINDDVTHTSLAFDPTFNIEAPDVVRCMFYGLGSDGTVGANKNSIKIIGEETPNYAQGYFVYDSKKSGTLTTSHLRFGPKPIRSQLPDQLGQLRGLPPVRLPGTLRHAGQRRRRARPSCSTASTARTRSGTSCPRTVQEQIIAKKLKLYVIDAYAVAKATGMGVRINTIMQTCFFAISGVLPRDEAIAQIKEAIKKTYGRRGEMVVQQNFAAVDQTLAHLYEVKYPDQVTSTIEHAAGGCRRGARVRAEGDRADHGRQGRHAARLAFPVDGTFPTATTQWEKRNIALEIPVWDPAVCIQCGKCALVCPHAAIRTKVYDPSYLARRAGDLQVHRLQGPRACPARSTPSRWRAEDCTGCGLCVEVCPAKNKTEPKLKAINMAPQPPLRVQERENFAFFLDLPELDRTVDPAEQRQELAVAPAAVRVLRRLRRLRRDAVRQAAQPALRRPGDHRQRHRLLLDLRRQPADHALGGQHGRPRPGLVQQPVRGQRRVRPGLPPDRRQADRVRPRAGRSAHRDVVGDELADGLLSADQSTEKGIAEQRARVAALKQPAGRQRRAAGRASSPAWPTCW